MTRDQKEKWINSAKGELAKEYGAIKWNHLNEMSHPAFVDNILEVEGCDDYIKASAVNWYLELATLHLIEKIDWTVLRLCRECEEIFDPTYGDDEFCSDECKEVYVEEAPDREER